MHKKNNYISEFGDKIFLKMQLKDPQKRESNIELLRIVAMVLVLVVHASFRSLGNPNIDDLSSSPWNTFLRVLSESFSIVCVNVFILISGWFGIKVKMSRFFCFLFQVYFLEVFVYILYLIFGKIETIHFRDWMNILLCNDYWFVRAYIILYIFAPALNAFIVNTAKRQIEWFLFSFYVIQTLFDFWWGSTFKAGYSGLSFMGLYMLARYLRLYPNKISQQNKYIDMTIYLIVTMLMTFLAIIQIYIQGNVEWFYYYDSPFVILAAVFLLLFFTKLSIQNKVINWIATSCFAAYIIHCCPLFFQKYLDTIKYWFIQEKTITFVCYTAIWIFVVFSLSILIDKVRIMAWQMLQFLWGKIGRMSIIRNSFNRQSMH